MASSMKPIAWTSVPRNRSSSFSSVSGSVYCEYDSGYTYTMGPALILWCDGAVIGKGTCTDTTSSKQSLSVSINSSVSIDWTKNHKFTLYCGLATRGSTRTEDTGNIVCDFGYYASEEGGSTIDSHSESLIARNLGLGVE